MELTLNELRIIRNALNAQLRTVCIESDVFIDMKKSLIKIKNEMERIESANKLKACNESFKAINQMFIPVLSKKEDTLDDLIKSIEAIDSVDYKYKGSEPYIKIEVDHIMLKEGELDRIFLFRDKNKPCLITLK